MTIRNWLASDEGHKWIDENFLNVFDTEGFFSIKDDSQELPYSWEQEKDIVPFTTDGGWSWTDYHLIFCDI